MLFGVKFTVLTQILPFILVGIGIDDAFVISGAFDATAKVESVPERMEKAIQRVGEKRGISCVFLSVSCEFCVFFGAARLGSFQSEDFHKADFCHEPEEVIKLSELWKSHPFWIDSLIHRFLRSWESNSARSIHHSNEAHLIGFVLARCHMRLPSRSMVLPLGDSTSLIYLKKKTGPFRRLLCFAGSFRRSFISSKEWQNH